MRAPAFLPGPTLVSRDVPAVVFYSWTGAASFTEGEIDEHIPEGPIGTGPFASMLLSVFGNGNNRFTFEGETTATGRSLLEYSFSVPQERSHYRVRQGLVDHGLF